jgi:hypothetical protein
MTATRSKAVFVNGKAVSPTPSALIGEGGEAEVYQLDSNSVLKLYKTVDHPSFAGTTATALMLQQSAQERIELLQQKLPQMPHLPKNAVCPQELARDSASGQSGRIVGYTAGLVKNSQPIKAYSQPGFRAKAGVTDTAVIDLFRKLHHTVSAVHKEGVIIGDFNPLNILVSNDDNEPYLIDCDSMQFSNFACLTYTVRYADPLNCKLHNGGIQLIAPHSAYTDWYAFALMLWECLLFAHPYGGVYRPQNPGDKISLDQRPLHRVSVFHPDVQYPAAAQPFAQLPPAVLDFYKQLLERDCREIFPLHLLDLLDGKAITAPALPGLVSKNMTATTGKARSRILFETTGSLLDVAHHNGSLRYIYFQNGKFFREDGSVIMGGERSANLQLLIAGKDSSIAYKNQIAYRLSSGEQPQVFAVESYRYKEPVLAVYDSSIYFVRGGELWCESANGKVIHIDSVVSNHTRIWVGERFGVGYFAACGLHRLFVFTEGAGKSNVDLPAPGGHISEVQCVIGQNTAWIFQSVQRLNDVVFQCIVIDQRGRLLSQCEIDQNHDDFDWFSAPHSKCVGTLYDSANCARDVLFACTEDGLVQFEIQGGTLAKTKLYADAKDFAKLGDNLIYTDSGLIAWDCRQIRLITSN